uniref:Uncharacterized protein n=1 Tax=Arundo donax TaxID=35708 RepID=A0A0A9AJG6_ARUDO
MARWRARSWSSGAAGSARTTLRSRPYCRPARGRRLWTWGSAFTGSQSRLDHQGTCL